MVFWIESESVHAFSNYYFISAMSLEIQLIIKSRRLGMPFYCACPKSEPAFTMPYVDIGEIVDHHLKQLLFHNT